MLVRMLGTLILVSFSGGALAREAAPGPQTPEEQKGNRPTPKRMPGRMWLEPAPPPPEPTSDPIEIFRRAAAAAKKLEMFYYEATLRGIGPLAADVPALWGTVVQGGESNGSLQKFRVMINDNVPGNTLQEAAMAGSDGKTFFLVDGANKTVAASDDPVVMGDMAQVLPYVTVPQLMHPEPFSKEMKADKLEFVGTETVSGKECYIVQVHGEVAGEQTMWFFSTQDALPRRVERIKTDAKGRSGTTRLTLAAVSSNPNFGRDPFQTFAGHGYKTIPYQPKHKTEQKTGKQ